MGQTNEYKIETANLEIPATQRQRSSGSSRAHEGNTYGAR